MSHEEDLAKRIIIDQRKKGFIYYAEYMEKSVRFGTVVDVSTVKQG